MNLIGMMLVKCEDWILGASLRAATDWCDLVIVLLHDCTDNSAKIVRDCIREGRAVLPMWEYGSEWNEMDLRQDMLEMGRHLNGSHFAIIDADEILTANKRQEASDLIQTLKPGEVLQVPMFSAWRSIRQYRTDPCVWSNRKDLSLAFADHPDLCWKDRNGYQFHHRHPYNTRGFVPSNWSEGGVIHAQWASWRRLEAKQTLYAMIERVRWPDRESATQVREKYAAAQNETGLQLTDAPDEWFHTYETYLHHVHIDHVPWQEAEIHRLLAEYGVDYFEGLDLKHFAT